MNTITSYAISKALQSTCVYKISAIGLNRKGDILGSAMNKRNVCRRGMGKHAEIELIKQYGRKIKTIIICRCNNRGEILPIHPCNTCAKIADRMGIKILTVSDI